MLRILKISALVSVVILLNAVTTQLTAQPVIDLQPQLPWHYDPSTGSQVGPWEMEVVLTDTTAPIVAWSVGIWSVYDPADDVPYHAIQLNSPGTQFVEWDITGSIVETADYISPLGFWQGDTSQTWTQNGCNNNPSATTPCDYYIYLGVIMSTSAPFTDVDFTSGNNIGTIKYYSDAPNPYLVNDVDGSFWNSHAYTNRAISVVTYNDGTEGFPASPTAVVDHNLSKVNSFKRGDVNGSGVINITDAMLIFFYAFLGDPITCLDVADVNDDGAIDVSDPVYLLLMIYEGGPVPPLPGSNGICGSDPSPDALNCAVDNCL